MDKWCTHFNLKDEKTSSLEVNEFNTIKYSNENFTKDCEIKEIEEENNLNESKEIIEELLNKEVNYKETIQNLKEELERIKEPILVGLNDVKGACNLNATLQCLSNTKKLTEFFLKKYSSDINKKIANEYYNVISNLWNRDNNNKSFSPHSFNEVLCKNNPLLFQKVTNTPKDIIYFLLEILHKELNKINRNNNGNEIIHQQTNEETMFKFFFQNFSENYNSPISNLFYGVLETKEKCSGCNLIKFNFQIFSILEFPLENINQYYYNIGKKPLFLENGKNPDINLYECFEYYRKIDSMEGENQMFCNICNKLSKTLFSTSIYSSPNYLIINLNRGKVKEYQCKVNFPEQLNIFNFVTFTDGITVYELYGVICHLPNAIEGHFVAFCKNYINHKWYLYDDATVTLCTKRQQYLDGIPYILFYKAAIEDT